MMLFSRLMLRPLRQEPGRALINILAVALGVGVVLAIDLSGQAAAGSFRSSLETLAGKADFEISATGGLPESLYGTLVRLPIPMRVYPRLEDYAMLAESGHTLPLLGLDLVSQALEGKVGERVEDGILLSRESGKRPGDRVRIRINDRERDFTVAALIDADALVMDIELAQRVLNRPGQVDRILVAFSRDDPSFEPAIRKVLPELARLTPFGSRTDENRKMLGAFRWNLRILSYIALVVGAFLIYNTISVSVVRRRAEIGILRALGMTRRQVLNAFLGEAFAIAAVGAAVGVPLGLWMARGSVHLLALTVDSLYVSSRPGPVVLALPGVLQAVFAGLGIALAAAFAPARDASRVAPSEAMARGRVELDRSMRKGRDLWISFVLLLAGGACMLPPPLSGLPIFGYLAAILFVAASALSTPMFVDVLTRIPLPRFFGIEAQLAARGLNASLRRTAVLVAALATSVGMLVSVGIMVGSFRETLLDWMDRQLAADLYLRPAGSAAADRFPTLSPEVPSLLAKVPGIEAVDLFRAYPISIGGLPATLAGGDAGVATHFSRLNLLAGDRETLAARLTSGDNVIVSEPFANKHNVHLGDRLQLPIAPKKFQVIGIYADYSTERGFVLMDRSTLLRYLPDPAPSSIAIYLKPGAKLDDVRRAVNDALRGYHVFVFSNRSLRVEAIRIFDRTFSITYALEIVAIFVAVAGIAGALLALVIDRRRELSLLRFLGAAKPQLRRIILCEAGMIGFLACLAGLILGSILSLDLVYVINRQSFGWTIRFHLPVLLLLGALTLIFLSTILAGLYPARMAMRLTPIEELHEE